MARPRSLAVLLTTSTAALGAAGLCAAAPAVAAKPGARTTSASQVTSTTARLNARVDPNGQSTTYSFQLGTTRRYGIVTPVAPAGSGDRPVRARADVTGLEPNTRYHFRVVASNASGVVSGADVTFRTDKQPLALTVTATPNPVTFGGATTLSGALSGTGGGGRRVQVQQQAFPYTSGWVNTGNPLVTAPDGSFAQQVLGLPGNTLMRVVTLGEKALASAPLVVGVAPVVRTEVSTTRPRRGRLVRFAGTVTPRWVPAQVAVQKRAKDGRWVTLAGTITRPKGAVARYAKRVRVRRGGTFRVFVGLADSRYTPTVGREIRIRVR